VTQEEALKFLSDFMERYNSQDNRATATPYYYVIKCKRWRVCAEGYSNGETRRVRISEDGEETGTFRGYVRERMNSYKEDLRELTIDGMFGAPKERLRAMMAKRKEELEKIKGNWEELEEIELEAYWEDYNVFFTEEGYRQHIAQNKHNLPEHHSYIYHAFRNPEIAGLLEAIGVVSGKPLKHL
jgi:hypothetical protein